MKAPGLVHAAILIAGLGAGVAHAQAPTIAKAKTTGPCATAGAKFFLVGTGFGAKGSYQVGVKKTTSLLATSDWSNNSISVLAPPSVSEITIQVGLKDGQGVWKSNTVGVTLCSSGWGPQSSYQMQTPDPNAPNNPNLPSPNASLSKKVKGAKKPEQTARPAAGPAGLRPLAAIRPSGFGPAARRGADEIVVLLRTKAARSSGAASELVDRFVLDGLGHSLEVRTPSAGHSADDAIRELRRQSDVLAVDRNDRLELLADDAQDPRHYATRLTGWSSEGCGSGARLGIIDTGIDAKHPWLVEARLESRDFTETPSRLDHGTAIAGLLVGREHGLVPGADLFVAGAVERESSGEARAAIAPVVRAFDWLVGERVPVINMSLGGERNQVLEEVVRRVLGRGVAVVAAAGNGGPNAVPVHPAAQEGVIAVAAVDARRKAWRGGNRGSYLDLAAPGVDLWLARPGSEGVFLSGTSFAAPFVSAALAVIGADASDELFEAAIDLGEPGPDPVYGRGMLQSPEACAAPTARAEESPEKS